MKTKSSLFAALGVLALASQAFSQNATTTPVGVVSFALDANKKTAISLPLEKDVVAQGTVSSVTADSLTDASAAFGSLANTHFVRIKTGNATGRNLKIISNTETAITVQTGTGNWALPVDSSSSNTVNVAVGDKYEIVPMWTFGEIFGTNTATCVLKTSTNPNNADQLAVYSQGTQASFFNNGTNWRNALNPGDTTNYNTVGIMPTSGIWVTRRSTGTNAELQFVGAVPSIAPLYQLPGGVKFGQAIPLPAGATLGNLGFSSMSTWNKNNNPNNADQVTVYRPDNTFNAYFVNASGVWRNALNPGDTTNYADTVIQAGSGLWITRRGSSSGPSTVSVSTLPYSVN